MDQATRVVFVGGHGRSGSTLLSRILGAVPGFCAVGEICYIWDQGVVNNRMCGCGAPFGECDFWHEVGQRAFGGWDEGLAREAWRLRKSVERVRYVPLMITPSVAAGYQGRLRRYAELMSTVYAAVRDVSGAEAVVDTSKYPSSAYLLRRTPGVDLRLVHLVRSSHGVCYSWSKHVARPDRGGKPMAQYPPVRTAIEWDVFNVLLRRLNTLGVPSTLLRYEDFVRDPRARVQELADFADVVTQREALPFVDDHTVRLPVDHSVAGNPMRFTTGEVPLRIDEAWKQAMPRATRALVTAMTAPGLFSYGYLPDRSR